LHLKWRAETCPIANNFDHTCKKDLTNPAFALILARATLYENRRRTTTGAPAPKIFVNQKFSGGFLVFSEKIFFPEIFGGVFHVEHTGPWLP